MDPDKMKRQKRNIKIIQISIAVGLLMIIGFYFLISQLMTAM